MFNASRLWLLGPSKVGNLRLKGHGEREDEKIFALSLMASQKVRPTALRRFFRTLTYQMYAFTPEKPPGLVGRNYCLAISRLFASASRGCAAFRDPTAVFRLNNEHQKKDEGQPKDQSVTYYPLGRSIISLFAERSLESGANNRVVIRVASTGLLSR